jgi:cyclopropane fatty-acyl-phospholipid synthase-like methyltransferase
MIENNLSGLSKQEFIGAWGTTGFIEDFSAYKAEHKDQIVSELSKHYNSESSCLEIGCGSGMWTREFLAPNFGRVVALDILPRETINLLKDPPINVKYIELGDRDYNCTGVEDNSVDFVFSFGVFCHFPNSGAQTYINSIYDKLKPGGTGLIMFSDFHRHFKYSAVHFDNEKSLMSDCNLQDKYRETEVFGGWYWNDMETIGKIFRNSPFNLYQDVTPDGFRDCLMFLSK